MDNLILNKLFKNIAFLALITIFLNSCGVDPLNRKDPIEPDARKRARQNVEEGRGFNQGIFGRKGDTNFEFATSNPLWRATLDTLDFMPLVSANYSGGIVITDWYSENNSNEAVKITVRFLTNEIRSDALDINVFLKECDINNSSNCKIMKNNNELVAELTLNILKRAAKYKKDAIEKNKKENPYVGAESKGGDAPKSD